MSPCCKAVKDGSRKHTVNLFLLLLLGGCRTNSEQGGNTVDPQILKRELYGNFLAFAKGYQFSPIMCQRLRDCHPIIITLLYRWPLLCVCWFLCAPLWAGRVNEKQNKNETELSSPSLEFENEAHLGHILSRTAVLR